MLFARLSSVLRKGMKHIKVDATFQVDNVNVDNVYNDLH